MSIARPIPPFTDISLNLFFFVYIYIFFFLNNCGRFVILIFFMSFCVKYEIRLVYTERDASAFREDSIGALPSRLDCSLYNFTLWILKTCRPSGWFFFKHLMTFFFSIELPSGIYGRYLEAPISFPINSFIPIYFNISSVV